MKVSRLERLQARSRRRNGTVTKKDSVEKVNTATEQRYRPSEIAKKWSLSVWTVRRLFSTVPGVLKIGTGSYKTMLIPESVLRREHEKLTK